MDYYTESYIAFIEVGEKYTEIIEAIHERGRFTDAFRLDPKIKRIGIYALSFDNENINYFAIGKKSGRVATYVDRINFTNFLDVNISIDQLKDHFPQLSVRLDGGFSVVRIPPAATKVIFKIIELYEPRLIKWLDETLQFQSNIQKNLHLEEKDDSFKLALQMANFDLKSRSISCKLTGNIPSFLEGIQSVNLTEDEMITHDLSIFGDWTTSRSDIIGMAVFEKNHEKLFIWNINRKPLESALGVDLIYFVEEYNCFVMIQYKWMTRTKDEWVYRANDKSYKKELANMRAFENYSQFDEAEDNEPRQFRLNNNPYYFKLCKSLSENNKGANIIPGMYIPLGYWEKIINHPTIVKGEKGGTAVGYHNANRWLTKDDFVNLVQKGWIGSNYLKSDIISKLIEASLKGERSVTLAARISTSDRN